jgi:tetratricopeptide (TPR) repeat protein
VNEILAQLLNRGLEFHKQKKYEQAEDIYHRVLNRKPFEECVLFLLGDAALRRGRHGAAVNFYSTLLQNNPKHAEAWCNLGIAFRNENFYTEAKSAWHKALEIAGDTVEVCSNFAGLYADRARPEEALAWCERSLKIDPTNVHACWQKALALLTLKRWEEGWKLYERRFELESWDSRKSIDVPRWDGSYVGHLYIHGEQGTGDEVMFASALPYVKAKHVTVEVNRKVAPLIQKSFPDFDVVTEETPGDYDAKVPIGSLIGRFGFNKEPYLKPDPWRVQYYRDELKKLGPGPYVALTWIGGTKQTRVEDRSVSIKDLQPIRDAFTCVSAQYLAHPMVEQERLEADLPKIDEASSGEDLHEQAALFLAVDAVVTVQQTAVHVAGSVGAPCYALIGSMPHWRYGIEGSDMPWYSTVKLYRNQSDWSEVVQRVLRDLHASHGRIQRTAEVAA